LEIEVMKVPSLRFSARKWHAWFSFALAVPILLVALTSVLIAHGQRLGFRDIQVDASWLPGYTNAVKRDVVATRRTDEGLWLGTTLGLYLQTARGVSEIDAFAGQEIRQLVGVNDAVFVLTTQGLFAQQDNQWQRVLRGPVANVYADGGTVFAVSRGKGLQMSTDGGAHWQVANEIQAVQAQLPPPQDVAVTVVLARVIRDLHTGDALLGKDGAWIWVDLVGGTMAFLGATGLVLWWKGQRRMVFRRRTSRPAMAATIAIE
jgi:hypothetical protein